MAFISGSRVDPRLLDYSGYAQGFANAAAIEAKALTDLGTKVGDTFTKYKKKKEDKTKREGFRPVVDEYIEFTNPDMPEDERNVLSKSIIDNGSLPQLQKLSTEFSMNKIKFETLKDLNQQKIDILKEKNKILGRKKPETFTGKELDDMRLAIKEMPNMGFDGGYVYKNVERDGKTVKQFIGPEDVFIQKYPAAYAFLHPDTLGIMDEDNQVAMAEGPSNEEINAAYPGYNMFEELNISSPLDQPVFNPLAINQEGQSYASIYGGSPSGYSEEFLIRNPHLDPNFDEKYGDRLGLLNVREEEREPQPDSILGNLSDIANRRYNAAFGDTSSISFSALNSL